MVKITGADIAHEVDNQFDEVKSPLYDKATDAIFDVIFKLNPDKELNADELNQIQSAIAYHDKAVSMQTIKIVVAMLGKLGVIPVEGLK